MAEDTKTYVFGNDSVPAWLAYGNNNNGFFGGNGLAGGALGFLLEMDCNEESFFKIKRLMESEANNIGFTYTNTEMGASLMLIGITDSSEEFQDTFDHEKGHLVMHISSALGIDPYSEDYQYLAGEVGKRMFKIAKKFLCDHCRQYIL